MNALKNMRKSRGMTQAQLAEKSHIDIRMIQHYEQGSKTINHARVVTVLQLADALECDIRDIIDTSEG